MNQAARLMHETQATDVRKAKRDAKLLMTLRLIQSDRRTTTEKDRDRKTEL